MSDAQSKGMVLKGAFQPETFAFSNDNLKDIPNILAKYPEQYKQSAVLPLLQMAQKQNQNWLPRAAMDEVARMLEMPKVRVYEVATFYSMFNLMPVGKHFVQVCTTTPCWLAGSDGVVSACKKTVGAGIGETSSCGDFTVVEVECLGACVNAPMVQINDDYFEDLNEDRMTALLETLKVGKKVAVGSQIGRKGSCAMGGATSLKTTKSAKKGA